MFYFRYIVSIENYYHLGLFMVHSPIRLGPKLARCTLEVPYDPQDILLSGWFLITIIGAARAGFLVPGRINLGAHFGGLMGDRRSARCSLLKTTPIVIYRRVRGLLCVLAC